MSDVSAANHPGGPLGWALVALITACGAVAAWLELLLTPLYLGSVIIPVTVLLALATNLTLPRLAYGVVPRMLAAVLPFGAWLGVVVVFGLVGRPEGDVILSGAGAQSYVGYALMLGGAAVGTISIVTIVPSPSARGAGRTSQPSSPSGSSR